MLILKGVRIGANPIIGAGSVATSSIPAGAVVVGNSARVIGEVPESADGEGQAPTSRGGEICGTLRRAAMRRRRLGPVVTRTAVVLAIGALPLLIAADPAAAVPGPDLWLPHAGDDRLGGCDLGRARGLVHGAGSNSVGSGPSSHVPTC